MKKFAALLMILSVSVFTMGCGEGAKTPAAKTPATDTKTPATDTKTPADPANTPAPAPGTEGETTE